MPIRSIVALFSWLNWGLLSRPTCISVARREVALPRPHHQILSCGEVQEDAHLPKSSIPLRIAGSVSKQILIPDVCGNAVADRSNLLKFLREKTLASGCLGQPPQHSGLLIPIGRVVKTNRVNHD